MRLPIVDSDALTRVVMACLPVDGVTPQMAIRATLVSLANCRQDDLKKILKSAKAKENEPLFESL